MSCNGTNEMYYCDKCINKDDLDDKFSSPVEMIGYYIAAASLICTLAMVADTFHGFRQRKFWFPCKYFTLNAASLTVIAVAMKLPVDLTTQMPHGGDQLAKTTSTAFLCVMMCNLLPSLGTMSDRELLVNLIALAILVITISVNVCIQINTGVICSFYQGSSALFVAFLLILLIMMIISALAVSISKKLLELKYDEMQEKIASKKKDLEPPRMFIFEDLKADVEKYWIMAETSSAQFMMACFETCSVSSAICVSAAAWLWAPIQFSMGLMDHKSDYKSSIDVICITQIFGGLVGSLAPAFRLFTALNFKLSFDWIMEYLNVIRIESYWTQSLVEWKQTSPLKLPIGGGKSKKLVHTVKSILLSFSIGTVTIIVVASKVIRLIPIFMVMLVVYICYLVKELMRKFMSEPRVSTTNNSQEDSGLAESEELSRYVLKLRDEVELSKRTLKYMKKSMNRFLHKARKEQPKNLLELLVKSKDFKGVAKFDSDKVDPLNSKEYLNCWSIPVITLTSIALAIPDINNDITTRLLTSVKEGLSYVKHIEMGMDAKKDQIYIRKAAKRVWTDVELHHKWLGNELTTKAFRGKTLEDILQLLSDQARSIVMGPNNKDMEENRFDWSVKVIAANSMYRITQTILLDYRASEKKITSQMLFQQVSEMIADILCACFTNLPRAIIEKCYCYAMEKREEGVRTATRLLGETEEILKILEKRKLPSLTLDQMVYIDEWRAHYRQHPSEFGSSFSHETTSPHAVAQEIVVG